MELRWFDEDVTRAHEHDDFALGRLVHGQDQDGPLLGGLGDGGLRRRVVARRDASRVSGRITAATAWRPKVRRHGAR